MAAAKSNGKSTPATCLLGWLGKVCAVKDGKTNAKEPHKSQCEPAGEVSPVVLPVVPFAVFTRQSPPNLPVRTSSARVTAGAINADTTATKLRKAAMRFHSGRISDDGAFNTTPVIETQAPQ